MDIKEWERVLICQADLPEISKKQILNVIEKLKVGAMVVDLFPPELQQWASAVEIENRQMMDELSLQKNK